MKQLVGESKSKKSPPIYTPSAEKEARRQRYEQWKARRKDMLKLYNKGKIKNILSASQTHIQKKNKRQTSAPFLKEKEKRYAKKLDLRTIAKSIVAAPITDAMKRQMAKLPKPNILSADQTHPKNSDKISAISEKKKEDNAKKSRSTSSESLSFDN